jgi:hypothetical protein
MGILYVYRTKKAEAIKFAQQAAVIGELSPEEAGAITIFSDLEGSAASEEDFTAQIGIPPVNDIPQDGEVKTND